MSIDTNINPGYKQTELGVIPNDWEIKRLESLCVKQGLVRGPFGGSLKKEFFVSNGIKVYEQKNAIYKSIELGEYFIDNKKYNELKRFDLKPGDFIVSCSGTIGKIYLIPNNAPTGIINQALLKITTNDSLIAKNYFLYYFDWENFQERIIDSTQGGAMKNLVGMSVFRETLIPVPKNINEQIAIANIISDVNSLIEYLEKQIAKKKVIKQGAMQELLTGKKRLPGFSGEWKQCKIGKDASLKARIGWQALTTKEYLDNGTYYLVTGTDFISGRVNWSSCHYVSKWRYDQDRNIQLKNGDVLVTKDGTIGKVGYVNYLKGQATLNSGVFVIRPLNESFLPQFLFYTLKSKLFDDFISKISAGSTITHLYQKDFVSFSFPVPSKEEQIAISEILTNMDLEIEGLEEKLNKYIQIKQGMMQQLLTGKIRVYDDK